MRRITSIITSATIVLAATIAACTKRDVVRPRRRERARHGSRVRARRGSQRRHLRGQDRGDLRTPLTGTRVIDAKSHVVAPGFIDLHEHGQQEESYR